MIGKSFVSETWWNGYTDIYFKNSARLPVVHVFAIVMELRSNEQQFLAQQIIKERGNGMYCPQEFFQWG